MQQQIKKIWCLIIALFIFSNTNAQCFNGDVEANNFTNWTGWTGVNQGGNTPWNLMVPGIVNGRHTIMNVGNDPVVTGAGGTLPMVSEGNHSIRLGNNVAGTQAEMIAYTFTVTSANYSFRYAMVLQSPNHIPQTQNPFFSYFISKGPAALDKYTKFNLIRAKQFFSDPANSFFHSIGGGSLVYSDWQTECIDLGAYIGQTLTIYFTTADCAQSAHFGYAYIDGLCKGNAPVPDFTYPPYVCVNDALWVDGSISQNVTDYYWKIEQLSNSSITSVIPGTAHQFNATNKTPGYISDLLRGTKFRLFSFPSGYYKLTLGVKNCFGIWVEKSVVIEIRLPQISVNEYIYKCCNDVFLPLFNATVEIANASTPGEIKWYDHVGTYLGTGIVTSQEQNGHIVLASAFTAPSPENGRYKVVYIDPGGCRNEKWVYVINKADFDAGIATNFCVASCNTSITQLTATTHRTAAGYYCGSNYDIIIAKLASQESNNSYLWNTGETTRTISTKPGMNNYSVQITNGCFTHTVSIDISTFHTLHGAIATSSTFSAGKIRIPLKMYPKGGGSIPVTPFTLYEWGLPAYGTPAYNATYYDFSIYNRFGERVHHQQSNAPCSGFWNGELTWDGIYKKKFVELGTYYYQLIMKNCDNQEVLFKGDFQVIY